MIQIYSLTKNELIMQKITINSLLTVTIHVKINFIQRALIDAVQKLPNIIKSNTGFR